jgi:Flp pilus assembly protein CpaB
MKRNLVPLLGIAFVVALAASGIFYGVFVSQLRTASRGAEHQRIVVAVRTLDRGTVLKPADLKLSPWAGVPPPGAFRTVEEATGKTVYAYLDENEPVTAGRTTADKANGGLGITKGMRGLSIHVVDSSGLIPFLHAGNHVDVQVVTNRSRLEANLRTILQNVEVLSVQASDNPNLNANAIVTLLASPEDADRVALADSGANIRLLLRNPLDTEDGARPGMQLAALFNDSASFSPTPAKPVHLVRAANDVTPPQPQVELVVRVGGASAKGMQEALAGIPGVQAGGSMQVVTLPKGKEGPAYWAALEQRHEVELFSMSRFTTPNLQESRMQAGSAFSMRFQPRIRPDHTLQLRIQPEVSIATGASTVATRKLVADLRLEDGQSLLVTGISEPGEVPTLAGRMFGNRVPDASTRELLVLVTPHLTAGH